MLDPDAAEGNEMDTEPPLVPEHLERGSFPWFCSWVLSEGFCHDIGNGEWAMPDYSPWAEGADPAPVKVHIQSTSFPLMA